MRTNPIGRMIAFCLILAGIPRVGGADEKPGESKSVPALKVLLNEGLVKRGSLTQISQTIQAAKRLTPDDPALDYAHGLVLLSRVQPAQAVERFQAALKLRPTYLPAWQALLRTRLIRKDLKTFQTEALQFAKLARDEEGAWRNEWERVEAAKWLGRAAGFLLLPEVDLLKDEERERFESAIKQALGREFDAIFAGAREDLLESHQKLVRTTTEEVSQESEIQEQQAKEDLEELTGQGEELDQKTESLKMSADQWKTWLDERAGKADDDLKTLEQDYKALQQAAEGVSRLIQQTQLDVGRYQTELAVQGILGRDADQQPAMIQLRQELTKYQVQYRNLEQQAASLLQRARTLMASRALAVKKYQQATGKIVQETQALSRWKKNVEEASEKIESRDPKAAANSWKKRLSMPASYFELDEKAELAKLIELAGGTLETP